MIIYFNLLIVTLQILSAHSVSIRNRQFRDELVPYLNSRLENYKRDSNSLRIVSDDPFIIQLQVPENWDRKDAAAKGDKEKKGNKKRPPTKRFPKLKSWRRRLRIRRDIQEASSRTSPATTEPKLNHQRKHLKGIRRINNQTSIHADIKNSVNRQEIKKVLNQVIKELKTNRSRDFKTGEERRGLEKSRFRNEKLVRERESSQKITLKNLLLMMSTLQNRTSHRNLFPWSDRSPIVKLTNPFATKSDQFRNGYREMKSDREKIENKMKNLRNLLKVNDSLSNEDLARVRRKTDSDKLANKIAKMFLTLSAVNGMNDRKKSKCKDDEDDEDDLWEQERRINPSRKNYSTNEERYKVKKWIEHMKNKRSGKTCPCMSGPTATGEFYDDPDVFPLEQKLGRDYPITAPDTSSEEESLEVFRNRQRNRKYYAAARQNRNRPRYFKSPDDADNKLNALTKRGRRKFELPLEDLDSYRSRAKQILQNAEEILDKLKEEEEKRLTNPNMFLSNLKELTSRIQGDPRSTDNDLIKMLQKSLGISKGENNKNAFIEGMKTYVLDPYEKAKALTDESTRQLTNYLLKNLANVGHSGEETDQSEALKAPEIKPLFQGVATDYSEPNKNVDLLKDINENIEKYSQISLPLPDNENLKPSDVENPLQRQMIEMYKKQNEKMKDLPENTNMSEADAMKHLKALEDVVKDFTTENERLGQDTTDFNTEEPSRLGERLKFLTDRKQGINQENPLTSGDKEINNPINTDPTVKDQQNPMEFLKLSENPQNENTMTSNNFQPEINGKEILGNKESTNGDDTTVGKIDVTSTDIKPTMKENENEEVMKIKEMNPVLIQAVSDEGNLMKKGEDTEKERKVLDDGSLLKLDDPKTEIEDKEIDYGILTSEGMDYQEKKPERDDLREPLISQVEKAGIESSKERSINDLLAEIVEKAQETESMNPDEDLGKTNNGEVNQLSEMENENPETLVKSALNDELIQTLEALDQKVEELIEEENPEVQNLPEKMTDIKESTGNGEQEENPDVRAENIMNALSSKERQNLDSNSKENKENVSSENGKETDFENLGKNIENSKEISGKSLEEVDSVKKENVGENIENKETLSSENGKETGLETLGKINENSKEISGKSLEETDLAKSGNVGESKENKETVSSEKDIEILEKKNENSKEDSGKSLEETDLVKNEKAEESKENKETMSSEKNFQILGKKNENSKEVSGKNLEEVDLVKSENAEGSKENKETMSSEKNFQILGKKNENSKEVSGKNLEEVDLVKSENAEGSIENKEDDGSENETDIENSGKKNENSKEVSGKSLEEIGIVKKENVGESKENKEMVSSEKDFENLSKKKNENFSKETSGKNSEEIGLKRDENAGESINNKEILSSENEKDVENLGKKNENSKEISGKGSEETDLVKSENVRENIENKETLSSENGKETGLETLGKINENSKEITGKSLEEIGIVKSENVGESKNSKETVSSENDKENLSKKKNENFSKETSGKNSEEIGLKRDENVGESINNKEILSSENEKDAENLGEKNENSKEITGKSLEEIGIVKSENVGESKENKETVTSENENKGDFQNLSQKDENSKEISGKSLEDVGVENNEDVQKTQDLSKETSELRNTSEKDSVDTGEPKDEKLTLPEQNDEENWNTENEKENMDMSDLEPSTLEEMLVKATEEENPEVSSAAKEPINEETLDRNDDSENTPNTETEKSLLEKMNSNERSDSREKDENVSGFLRPLKDSSEAKDAVGSAGVEINSKENADVGAENPIDSLQKELDENKDFEIIPDLEEKTSGEEVSSKTTEMSNEEERTGSALADENTNVKNDDPMTTDDNENILEKAQSKEIGSVENDENIADPQNLSKEVSEVQKAIEENISGEKNKEEDAAEVRAENPIDGMTEEGILNKPDDLISNTFSENKNVENDEADTVGKEDGLTQDGDDMMNKEVVEPKADILYDMMKEGDNVEDSLKYPDAENVDNEALLENLRSEDNMEKEDTIGEAEETGSEVLNLENAEEELQNGYEEMKTDQSDAQTESDPLTKDSGSSKELNEKAEEELVEVENPSMTEMEDTQPNSDDNDSITRSSNTDDEAKTDNISDENETLVQMNEQENVEVPEEKSENIVEDSQSNGEDVLMPKSDEHEPEVGDNADQNDKNDDPAAMLVQTAGEGMLKENEAGESPEVESVRKESQDLPDDQLTENEAGVSPEEVGGMKRESQNLSGERGKNDEITGNENDSFEGLTEPDGEKETKDDAFTRSERKEGNDSNVVESDEDPTLTMIDALKGKERDEVLRESYTPDELVQNGNQEEKDKSAGLSGESLNERDDESAVQFTRDENTDENAEPKEELSDENFSDNPVKSENVLGNDGDEMTSRNMNEADGTSTEENVSGDEVLKKQANLNDYGELGNNAQEEENYREKEKEYDESLRLKKIDPNYQTSGEMGRHEQIYEYEENKSADMYDDFDNLVGSHEDGRYIHPTNRKAGENLRGENLLKDADYENFIDDISELTRKEGKEYADYFQGRGRFPPTPDQLVKDVNSKPGKLKIPQSFGKIMKDLGGSKEDLQNLGPDQIDHLIDKLEEADEQEQKESEEVDCREECACADNIRAISRNRGRYEIMKDVLLWMKDMQLNRVLSD